MLRHLLTATLIPSALCLSLASASPSASDSAATPADSGPVADVVGPADRGGSADDRGSRTDAGSVGQDAGSVDTDPRVVETDAGPGVPDGWNCDYDYFGTDDGCDCGCGGRDPDCDGLSCADPGCAPPPGNVCEYCYGVDGEPSDCAECDNCVVRQCEAEVIACNASAACLAQFSCLCGAQGYACTGGCPDDGAQCAATCRAENPDDGLADAVSLCTLDSCASECGL